MESSWQTFKPPPRAQALLGKTEEVCLMSFSFVSYPVSQRVCFPSTNLASPLSFLSASLSHTRCKPGDTLGSFLLPPASWRCLIAVKPLPIPLTARYCSVTHSLVALYLEQQWIKKKYTQLLTQVSLPFHPSTPSFSLGDDILLAFLWRGRPIRKVQSIESPFNLCGWAEMSGVSCTKKYWESSKERREER